MMYKEASKLKLRVQTEKGPLTVEQLWDLPVAVLDRTAVTLQELYKDSGKKSFLVVKSKKDKLLKLQFDIVLDILNTKVEENDAATSAAEVKAHNQKIIKMISEKQDQELAGKSVKELEKMLK